MIYGRWGDEVRIVRMGTLEDVRILDKRKPDAQDRKMVEQGSYVVVEYMKPGSIAGMDNPKHALYHLAYLRADEGLKEIMEAIEACQAKEPQ